MFRLIVITIPLVFLSVSCKQKGTKKNEKPAIAETKDTTTRFPIMEMLKEDINEVQKVPYFIYKNTYTLKNNRLVDSVAVSPEKFAQIIAPLLQIDIASNAVKDKFKEVAFHDLSTQSISIVTTSTDEESDLRTVTALLNDETDKLKSFFVVMEKNSEDTLKKTSYYWKAGKSLTISQSIQLKGKTLLETKEFINWNDIAQ